MKVEKTSLAVKKLKAMAKLRYSFVYYLSGGALSRTAEAFQRLMAELPKPVLAFLRFWSVRLL